MSYRLRMFELGNYVVSVSGLKRPLSFKRLHYNHINYPFEDWRLEGPFFVIQKMVSGQNREMRTYAKYGYEVTHGPYNVKEF